MLKFVVGACARVVTLAEPETEQELTSVTVTE